MRLTPFFVLSKIFCETDAQLTHQFISFHLAPVVGSYLISQTESCKNIWSKSRGNHFDPEVAVRVRQGPLWSRAYRSYSWAPAGITLIQRLLFGCGGDHCDLAVRAPQGPLRSRARSWGPAGVTLIQRLLFGSGGDRCDLALAVISWGPAGTALILGLLLRSGGDGCDPELAVEVRQGPLWSWACRSGPAENTAI